MNKEKLAIFIGLIDEALSIAKEHRKVMDTPEFYERCKKAGLITEEDIKLGKEHLEKEHDVLFHYQFLDRNIIGGLENLKRRSQNLEIAKRIAEYPKGQRGNFGFTRGMSDYECLWGDCLYDDRIYKACGAVEDYYNRELE